jgi:uncharacterized protein YfaS (alpha-2-macroglobulin family)
MANIYKTIFACIICAVVAGAIGSAIAATSALQIRRISPSGTDVQPGQEVVFQFDRPMARLGNMARKPSALPIKITPELPCQWRWLNVSELACRLPGKAKFRPATHYSVTVGTALTALDGAHLAQPVTRTFTTERPKVDWVRFRKWRSPVMPAYLVRFNLPVTPGSVKKSLYFAGKKASDVAVRVETFTGKRSGPLWLPVPDAPDAVMEVEHPKPKKPLDVNKKLGAARRVWVIAAAKPLAPASHYKLKLRGGLKTPLGPLAGQSMSLSGYDIDIQSYGPFKFAGIECHNKNNDVTVSPSGHQAQRCEPGNVDLLFTAPVPRVTLAATQWHPRPLSKAKLTAQWKNYATWRLRPPSSPSAAAKPDHFPLPFNLAAMKRYKITIPAGVKDRFGRTLDSASTVTFRTGHRVPFFTPPPKEAVLETHEPTIVPLGFTNLTTLKFSYRRLFAEDFNHSIDHPFRKPALRTEQILERPGLHIKPDQIATVPLGIRDALDGYSGVVWGDLDWAPARHRKRYPLDKSYPSAPPRRFFGEVTPYEIVAKAGHFNTLVWVKSFKTGKAIAGAKVGLLEGCSSKSPNRSSPAGGKVAVTDAHGLAMLPGVFDLLSVYAPHDCVAVTKGHTMGLLPLDRVFRRSVGEASDYAVFENTAPRDGHMRTWAVTEQGIYRPGSDVRFAVFARNVSNTKLVGPPLQLWYTLKVSDPRGNTVLKKKKVLLSAFGGAHEKLHIPKTAPSGWYTITLGWNTTNGPIVQQAGKFLVTDFVPASFKVEATLKGARFGPGASVHGRADAKLHAGGPYTDAKVKFTTRIVAQEFTPNTPITSGFDFSANPKDAPQSATISQTQGRLDHSGEAATHVKLPARSKIHYGALKFETSVESARGTWVADRASAEYAARDRFIGLRLKQWLMQADKSAKVRYLVVDVGGKPRADTAVRIELQRKKVSSVRVKNAAGYFTTEQTTHWVTEDRCRAVSSVRPDSCKLTPQHAGSYRIRGEIKDTQGRSQVATLSTWATGPGEVTWSQGKGVRLIPDQSEYHVGETAHVLVQNPYPGARALVTVERYGVLWKKTVKLAGGAPVIDIPIGKTFFPGAYLSVTIFSPRVSEPGPPDLGRPEVALGYKPLKIVGKGSSLKVSVSPDQPIHKPRQTVHVRVKVHHKSGGIPGKTRLIAVAVDQAVVDLLQDGAHYYDPRTAFYAPPDNPDVVNFSLAEQLLTRLEPKWGKGENPGGGGGVSQSPGPDVRSIFKYAAYWNAGLTTNKQGRAQFAFKLPDNLTRWRIFVIALTPGAAMGVGDASVRVNLPIQIQPALPNQVHAGDHFGAGFSVTNRTADTHKVTTYIQAQGPIAGGKAQARGSLGLASYAHGLSWLDLTANKPGTIQLTGTARSGQLGDAVKTHIPVRRAVAPIVAAQYGSTTGAKAHVPVKVPADALAHSTHLDVTLAPTLITSLEGAFVTLRDNPLRTWETRLSRGVLGADYLRLKPVIGDTVHWPAAAASIENMLASAADFQAPDGGMAFLIPRDEFVSPYLSVYTALAFDWLSDMGHRPPAGIEAQLRAYLHKKILNASPKAGTDEALAAPILKAGALAALAPNGQLPHGAVAGMLPQLPRLDLFGQALLLHAALDVHDHASAKTIVKSILSNAEESAGSISFNQDEPGAYLDILATPLRANCAVLDALVEYKKNAHDTSLIGATPEKLMRWVIAQKRNAGGWPNSQENVFCTTAIAHYAGVYEHPIRNLKGTVNVAGKTAGHAAFKSRRAPAKTVSSPPPAPGQSMKVALAPSGKGRLYYNVRLRYAVPPDAVPMADAGLTVKRQYYRRHGGHWLPVGPETVLKRGDIVRVDLTVDAPTERHHVVLTDPLPGAFEAVNRKLATAPQNLPSAEPKSNVLMFDYSAWPNASITTGGFYHRETAFDAVRFFADDLPAGHYHLVYAAQVISPGRFVAPAAHAKEIYQPDVFGRGKAQHLRVMRQH